MESTVVFTIERRGRIYKYATLQAAQEVAGLIFRRTGVIVGIQAQPVKRTK